MTVTVSVYTLSGSPVWSQTETGRSDMFLTQPLTWNLTDNAAGVWSAAYTCTAPQ